MYYFMYKIFFKDYDVYLNLNQILGNVGLYMNLYKVGINKDAT